MKIHFIKKAKHRGNNIIVALVLIATLTALTACGQAPYSDSEPDASGEISESASASQHGFQGELSGRVGGVDAVTSDEVPEPGAGSRTGASDETSSAPEPTAELQTKTRDELLGTVITVSLYSDDEKLFNDCFAVADDVDRRMTNNTPDSEISVLNQKSGQAGSIISPDTQELLSLALDVSRKSGGAFDVSIGAVMNLWKENGSFARLPSAASIRENLLLVSYRNITLKEGNAVKLEKAGMALDLGAIAKGYACDLAVKALRKNGVQNAFLDFGGNIYACGTKAGGKKWRVGVRYPAPGDSGIACVLDVSDKTVVTSGGYERYFEKEGTIYHHILDPKTGYSAKSGLKSVTIVTESSALADALSTACYVLGLADGVKLLEKYEGCEGIFITDDGKLYATAGLTGQVQIADDRLKPYVP